MVMLLVYSIFAMVTDAKVSVMYEKELDNAHVDERNKAY